MISGKIFRDQVAMNLALPPLIKRCLFCAPERNSFTSKEHVFPESLGNDTVILPPGVVCDKCNNYFSSKLENQFIHRYPMLLGRFLSPKTTKKRNWPKTPLPRGGFIHGFRLPYDPVPTVQIQVNGTNPDEIGRLQEQYRSNGPEYTFPSIPLPEENLQESSRVLAKIALELMYLHSPEFAFHPACDHVRNFARQASRNEFLPYAWSPYIGMPFLHCPIMERSAAGAYVSMSVFFTIPGARYLVPIAPPCASPSFSILADGIGLRIQTRRERSKPTYLDLNVKSAYLP